MAPVGAGPIAAIETSQVFAGGRRHGRFQRRSAEANPGLQMTGAGLQHDTGVISTGAHAFDHGRIRVIQIDEDIAGVSVAGVGLDIDVAAFAVASAQEAMTASQASWAAVHSRSPGKARRVGW
jgi:hypothetical protein